MKVDLFIKFIDENVANNLYSFGINLNYQTSGSSGFDLRANCVTDFLSSTKFDLAMAPFLLKARSRCLVHTGIFTEFAEDFELQIRSRSGLAWKNGVFVLNSPGTIDSDYRGEIGVILFNSSDKDFEIKYSERIAQAILCPIAKAKFIFKNDLSDSSRGDGGFGSTGRH